MESERFKSILDQVLNESTIEEIEQARMEMKARMRNSTFIAVAIVLAIFIMIALIELCTIFPKKGLEYIAGAILVGIVILAVITCKKKEKRDSYNEVLQDKIIKPLVKLAYNNYTYIPEDGINSSEFSETGIYVYNSYNSSGLTYGSISRDYQFRMTNLEVDRFVDNFSTDTWDLTPIFHGLFMKIKVKKVFPNNIYLTDKRVLKKEENMPLRSLQLDEEQFGKKYILYSQDINLVENIFSDKVIQELLRYYHITKQKCEIVIKEGYIYLMFPNTYTFGNIIIYENREQMYQELYKQYAILKLVFDIANVILEEIEK